MTTEKSNLISTFNYNGISIVLLHNEGTNQIGCDERFTVYTQSEHENEQMNYLHLHQAIEKFDKQKTHAINWSIDYYRNDYLRRNK